LVWSSALSIPRELRRLLAPFLAEQRVLASGTVEAQLSKKPVPIGHRIAPEA
jgi:hypothetical protein